MKNILKTTFLLTALTFLFIWIGGLLGGREGMRLAFFMACAMNFFSYWFSDKIVLAVYRAQPLPEDQAPEVHQIVRELAAQANIPMPRIYRMPSPTPNAFATGRNPKNAAVVITDGIFQLLNHEELKGVLAHELSHVLNRDILISSIAATLAGAISMITSWARWGMMFGGGRREGERDSNPIVLLAAIILMPIAAMLIQLAVSRSREYGADETGSELCGNPLYLASALRKLDAAAKRTPMFQADPASAHLFIVNPLKGANLAALFSTHPPMEERIARLERMAKS